MDSHIPDHAVIFMYHHVSSSTPASTSVTPEVFISHLDYLDQNGFKVWPLSQIVENLKGGISIPDSTVAITFDDGYRSVYTQAFPLLKEKGWPFTVFVSAEAMDQGHGPVATWDELRKMAEHGGEVANHGRYHQHMNRNRNGESDSEWAARIQAELEYCQTRLKEEMGTAPPLVAYTYGEHDPRLLNLIRKMGWAGFGQQSGAAGENSDMACLPRFPMATSFAKLEDFALKAASLPLPIQNIQMDDLELKLSPTSVILGAQPPRLVLELAPDWNRVGSLAAYASGQGRADVRPLGLNAEKTGFLVEIQARGDIPAGRSRYNITAPAPQRGRWHWFSHTWVVGQDHQD